MAKRCKTYNDVELQIEEQANHLVEEFKAPKQVLLGRHERALIDEEMRRMRLRLGKPKTARQTFSAFQTVSGLIEIVEADCPSLVQVI